MTTKTNQELQNQAQVIINNYNLKTSPANYKLVEVESLVNALLKAKNEKTFIRVKKQFNNVLNTIEYAVESDLIKLSDYVIIDYTKNFINRGTLINAILEPYKNYYNSIGKNLKIHLLDTNNPASCKQFTTNENSIIVCDSGIYLNNIKNCYYDYNLTSDKNKQVVKKLKDLKNLNGCIVEW